MGSSSVVGGECAWCSAGEDVEVDPERQGEESLRDPCDEPGQGFGEVILEIHLALEGREHRFDHQPGAGFGDLAGGSLVELVLGRG